MNAVEKLENRRRAVVEEMLSIRAMRRGCIKEQYLNVRHKGKDKPVKRGPYYVFARWNGKKTESKRLKSKEEVEAVQEEIRAYECFAALCRQFEELTEKLGELERQGSEMDVLKKTPKSRLRRTRR